MHLFSIGFKENLHLGAAVNREVTRGAAQRDSEE